MIPRRDPSARTIHPSRHLDFKSVAAVLVIVTSVYFGCLKPGYGMIQQIIPGRYRSSFGIGIACGDNSIRWFESDINHLTRIIQDSNRKAYRLSTLELAMRLKAEIVFLEHEINLLRNHPSYSDPELGFHVFDADATGWLHVLYKAVNVRRDLLNSHFDPSVVDEANVNELPDGTPLYEAAPGKEPKVEEVADTLAGMALPPLVFRNYRVYILPFSMGEISGLGSKGYMLLGTPPAGREVIENQTAFTIAHEIGHHVHMTFLGVTYEENPKGWDEYMRIRGISAWAEGGDVNTKTWFESTEETFAEDVRVLFGPERAASEPHGTAYRDPRVDPVTAEKFKVFIDKYTGTC